MIRNGHFFGIGVVIVGAWLICAKQWSIASVPKSFENLKFDASLDPRLGALLALPTADVFSNPIERKPTVVVYAPPCASCTVDSFSPKHYELSREYQGVLIVPDASIAIRKSGYKGAAND